MAAFAPFCIFLVVMGKKFLLLATRRLYLKHVLMHLIDLLERKHLVWHGRDQKAVAGLAGFSSKSGYASLDEKLEGGLPKSGVVSFNSPFGIGELRLLVPTMLSKEHLHVFINPPGNLNAEFLHHQGFDLNLIFIIHTNNCNS